MGQKHPHSREPWTDVCSSTEVTSPAVNWIPVDKLDASNTYIDYTEVIKYQRLPTIFPEGINLTAFAGGLFVEMRGEPRRVYYEGSSPAKPRMVVTELLKDEDTVTTNYSWDTVNFVYNETESGSYTFYIYTPANLNSYGLVVENDEDVYFKPTPDGKQEELTLLQIDPLDQERANIKTVIDNKVTDVGLYIDMKDGWKVKATSEQEKLSKFWITGFSPQKNL